MPAPVQALLGELGDEAAAGFVFAGLDRQSLVCRHALDLHQVSVERATPHDLRRTFSTTVTGLGFGRDGLNRVTNHKEGGIASVYDRHGYAEENKKVVEATVARIMSLVEGRTNNNVVAMQRA